MNNPLKYNDPTGHIWEHPTENKEEKSSWFENPQYKFMGLKEWVNQGGRPIWVSPEEYAKNPSAYTLWTEMEYDSADGRVKLDPRGPNPETPWGWTLDSIAVGDPSQPALQPSAPGVNRAESTATNTPPRVMNSMGDPRRNWLSIYQDANARRSRAQALFPDSRGLDAERHRWATRQTALRWGTGTARILGGLNEMQGFIFYDLRPLIGDTVRATQSGIFISTRGSWAFQWSDLQHNERGIDEANILMNQVPK